MVPPNLETETLEGAPCKEVLGHHNEDDHQQYGDQDDEHPILEDYVVYLEEKEDKNNNEIDDVETQQRILEETNDNDKMQKQQQQEQLWNHATEFLKPSRLFKWAIYFYSERKLISLFFLHLIATIIIWLHYSLIRYQSKLQDWQLENDTAPTTNSNHPKFTFVIVPSIAFGCKHAILFQLMLLPLSMAKYTIANLEGTPLGKLIPLHKTLTMHLYVGYLAAILVVAAFIYFLTYYGILCSQGYQEYCEGLHSEIMFTGYTIVGLLVLLYTTSYFRHSIPYEIFYYVHQTALFLVYFIMIIHTIDYQHRDGSIKLRYQTWPWLIFTFGFYLIDRITMACNAKFQCKIQTFHLIEGSINNSKMIVLKLTKPTLMKFQPGQYAFLQLQQISNYQWHPFTIASEPNSSTLDFYIEVFDKTAAKPKQHSWTNDLWTILKRKQRRAIGLQIEVMGPYGVSLVQCNESYSHVLAVGAGTGLVPVFSLLKQHISKLLRLEPKQYMEDLYERRESMYQVALAKEEIQSSLGQKAISSCRRRSLNPLNRQQKQKQQSSIKTRNRRRLVGLERTKSTIMSDEISRSIDGMASSASASVASSAGSVASSNSIDGIDNDDRYHNNLTFNSNKDTTRRKLKIAITKANKYLYGRVILCGILVLGFMAFMVGISFNTIPLVEIHDWMMPTFGILTISFQICFAVVSIFCWNASDDDGMLSFIDLSLTLSNPFIDWYFYNVINLDDTLQPTDLLWYSIITLYMIGRVWFKCVSPSSLYDYLTNGNNSSGGGSNGSNNNWDKFHLIWTTRSVGLVADILPDILETWDGLVSKWGLDDARKLCQITIYITDPSKEACQLLQNEIQNTSLYQLGCFKFERPNFEEIVKRHSIETMSTCRDSTTLFGFCGSPMLATKLFETKISNDIVIATTGQRSKHKMNFVCESFGGVKPGKKARVMGTENKQKQQGGSNNSNRHDSNDKKEQAVVDPADAAGSRPLLSNRHTVRRR